MTREEAGVKWDFAGLEAGSPQGGQPGSLAGVRQMRFPLHFCSPNAISCVRKYAYDAHPRDRRFYAC